MDTGNSDNDVEGKLIDLVRQRKLLFDKRVQDYKNRSRRNMAWDVIGKELNRPADYCQKLWISLRSQYMAHRRKLRTPSGSGTAVNRPYFRHEGTMRFLKDALGDERSYSSVPSPPFINLGESEYEQVSEEPSDAAEKEVLVQRKTSGGCKANKIPKTQKRKLDLFEEGMLKVVRNEIDDEYAAFGKLVAIKLRKLANEDPMKCNEVQLDITTLLYQFEAKKL